MRKLKGGSYQLADILFKDINIDDELKNNKNYIIDLKRISSSCEDFNTYYTKYNIGNTWSRIIHTLARITSKSKDNVHSELLLKQGNYLIIMDGDTPCKLYKIKAEMHYARLPAAKIEKSVFFHNPPPDMPLDILKKEGELNAKLVEQDFDAITRGKNLNDPKNYLEFEVTNIVEFKKKVQESSLSLAAFIDMELRKKSDALYKHLNKFLIISPENGTALVYKIMPISDDPALQPVPGGRRVKRYTRAHKKSRHTCGHKKSKRTHRNTKRHRK